MPLVVSWPDIAVRLALTVLAGAILGFDRERRGHAAGLRTTILVGLAAALAMVEVNVLLPIDGKPQGSFATLDLMRLPLGILTGVGFIGGGTILKRDGGVTGITTAATLWIATTIGLCFGAGQTGLGLVATGLAWLVLRCVKQFEAWLPRRQDATLTIVTTAEAPPPDLVALLNPQHCRVRFLSREARGDSLCWSYALRWRGRSADEGLTLMAAIARVYAIERFTATSDSES